MLGIRTLHDSSHCRTVHQVAVFARRDDNIAMSVPMVTAKHSSRTSGAVLSKKRNALEKDCARH